jgi:hypothetical protein
LHEDFERARESGGGRREFVRRRAREVDDQLVISASPLIETVVPEFGGTTIRRIRAA